MVHRLSYSSRTFSRTFPAAQLFRNPQFSAFTHHNMLWCVKAEKKASIIIAYCWWKSKSFFKKRRNWEVWFPTPYIRSFLNQPPIYSIISDISNLSRSSLYVYSLLLSSIFVNSSEKKFYFSLYYILWFLTVAMPAVKNRPKREKKRKNKGHFCSFSVGEGCFHLFVRAGYTLLISAPRSRIIMQKYSHSIIRHTAVRPP